MKSIYIALIAAVLGFSFTATQSFAADLTALSPCPAGQTYLCEGGGCSCKRAKSPYWFIAQPAPTSGALTSSGGTANYKCVPELQQCGCTWIIDCIHMFMNLKVKCEWFGCDGDNCVCHFPNNIPN